MDYDFDASCIFPICNLKYWWLKHWWRFQKLISHLQKNVLRSHVDWSWWNMVSLSVQHPIIADIHIVLWPMPVQSFHGSASNSPLPFSVHVWKGFLQQYHYDDIAVHFLHRCGLRSHGELRHFHDVGGHVKTEWWWIRSFIISIMLVDT